MPLNSYALQEVAMFQKFVGFAMIAASLLVGSASAAKPERLEAIRQAIFAIHPDSNFRDDEFADVAYLVHGRESNDVILGVLRGQARNIFLMWESSKPFSNAHHGYEIDIKRQSVFINGFNGGPASNFASHWTPQFQFRNGAFQLVGDESSISIPFFDDDPSPKESVSTSTNYLTRKVITTTIKNKNKTVKIETLPADRKLTRLRDYGDL